MNTRALSSHALSVIGQYTHFKAGIAACSIPYFNNKTVRIRAGLRVYLGKGSPLDIFDEIQALCVTNRIAPETLNSDSLKKILVENNIGIDCSGFAYYILNAESEERYRCSLDRHLSFVNCKGIIGKIRCSMRPVENCDVVTLASDKNSCQIRLSGLHPGDFITMLGQNIPNDRTGGSDRDHILVISQIEYQNFIPFKIHYVHAIAYPEDGSYGSGIKSGTIEIALVDQPLTEGIWTENNKVGNQNAILQKAKRSRIEVRRLNWFD